MPRLRNIPKKNLQKFILCWTFTTGRGGSAVEKTNHSFADSCQLEIASWLGLGTVVGYAYPLSTLGAVCINLCRPRACCHSFCERLCASILLCQEDTISLVPSIPSGIVLPLSESFFACQKYSNSHSLVSWLQKSGVCQSPLCSHSESVPFSPCCYNFEKPCEVLPCVFAHNSTGSKSPSQVSSRLSFLSCVASVRLPWISTFNTRWKPLCSQKPFLFNTDSLKCTQDPWDAFSLSYIVLILG